jgi:cation/acetate symporter
VYAQSAAAGGNRLLTFSVFAVIIVITMYVTYLAAKRVHSASDFYTHGGGVSGWQNGWAIAGDIAKWGDEQTSFMGVWNSRCCS